MRMEGINNEEYFQLNTNVHTSGTADVDNALQSNAQVREIQQMREATMVCKKNIESYQKVLTDAQQSMQDQKVAKTELEKTVIKLQCELNEMNHQNSEIRIQIDDMRIKSNRIGDYLIQKNNTLRQCSESKIHATDLIKKQTLCANENLTKKMQVFKNEQAAKNETIELISNQRKAHKEDLKIQEGQCLQKIEQINLSTNKLENLRKLSEELHQSIEDSRVAITYQIKEKECLRTAFLDKQKYHNEILQEIHKQQNSFEESKEKIGNMIDENDLLIRKIETEIEMEERGASNQKVYNTTLKEKISQRRFSTDELLSNTKLLEIDENECKDKYKNDINELNNNHILRLESKENMESKKLENIELLKNIEQDIQNLTQLDEESHLKLKSRQSKLNELQYKRDENLREYSIYEQKISLMSTNIDEIKQAIDNQQQNIEIIKKGTEKLRNNLNTELHQIEKQNIQLKEEGQNKKATIIGEMNLIKSNFDIETAKQTQIFESIHQQLQNEKQQLDKQLRNANNSRVLLQDELKNLNEKYDAKRLQLKNEENVKTVKNQPTNNFQNPTIPVANTVQEFLSPRSITQKSFDELSSSSADSALFMYRQVMDEKKRRRDQIRKQAKREARESKRKRSNDTSQKLIKK